MKHLRIALVTLSSLTLLFTACSKNDEAAEPKPEAAEEPPVNEPTPDPAAAPPPGGAQGEGSATEGGTKPEPQATGTGMDEAKVEKTKERSVGGISEEEEDDGDGIADDSQDPKTEGGEEEAPIE